MIFITGGNVSKFIFDEISEKYTDVEYEAIDIEKYALGNTGIPYLWSFDSGKPGPHLMVCGIMHGNEIAGAVVLHRLLSENIQPLVGKLTLCFGNPKAYKRFDKKDPTSSRFVDQDINRVWGKELSDLSLTSYELTRARELSPIIETVDLMLDIHSMQASGPAVALLNDTPAALECAQGLSEVPFIITGKVPDPESLRLRDLPCFAKNNPKGAAIQIEAGQHWESETVENADRIVRQFLENYGLILPTSRKPKVAQKRLKTIQIIQQEGSDFHYMTDIQSGDFFAEAGSLIGMDGNKEIVTPVDNCYFIMPVHFRRFAGPCGRLAVEF